LDFRDHYVHEALARTVGPFRPERTRRARLVRIAAVALLTVMAVAGFLALIQVSAPRPAPSAAPPKPGKIDILLVPAPASTPRPGR